jgi:hypothetical protein
MNTSDAPVSRAPSPPRSEAVRAREGALLAGPLLILAAVVTAIVGGEPGGLARVVGLSGLAALLLCAASRAVRRYRAATTASLPTSIARVFVRTRPLRIRIQALYTRSSPT